MYSLKMSVCSVPLRTPRSTPCRSAATRYMQKTGTAGPLIVIDVVMSSSGKLVEQHLHVGGRVDRHAAVADLAEAHRVVGVAAHQGGHVERDRQAAAAALEDHLVALVGLHGVAEAGELADRPGAAAVAGRVEAAGERVLPRPADPLGHLGAVGRAVDGLDRHLRQRGEVGVAHLTLGLGGVVAGLPAGGAVAARGGGGCGVSAMPANLLGRPSKCHPPTRRLGTAQRRRLRRYAGWLGQASKSAAPTRTLRSSSNSCSCSAALSMPSENRPRRGRRSPPPSRRARPG